MQIHRNDDGDSGRRRANPSPPVANRVHALGESHALRVDFEPVQLPWLADEVDTLRRGIEHGLVRTRAFDGEHAASAAEAEVARREYQLQVLGMIRDQVPVRAPVAAACVASPWDDEPSELVLELAGITAPIPVIGPARAMRAGFCSAHYHRWSRYGRVGLTGAYARNRLPKAAVTGAADSCASLSSVSRAWSGTLPSSKSARVTRLALEVCPS